MASMVKDGSMPRWLYEFRFKSTSDRQISLCGRTPRPKKNRPDETWNSFSMISCTQHRPHYWLSDQGEEHY